jgi:hypothetical protein
LRQIIADVIGKPTENNRDYTTTMRAPGKKREARANDRLQRLVRYYAEPNILYVPRDSK